MGGLGNQLFQIFATISYALKSKRNFKFLNNDSLPGVTVRYTYWKSFFEYLKQYLIHELPSCKVIRENGFPYNEIYMKNICESNDNIMIYGYFQSYKYFEENYTSICKIIKLNTLKNNLLDSVSYNKNFLDKSISLHFRLGDYKNLSDYHPILTYEYYYKSLDYIYQNTNKISFNVLYFCEDEDIDTVEEKIDMLKQQFPNYIFTRGCNNLKDWEQMLLMSFCHHNIIANSTFSWWAAYFNSNKDKMICYPSIWFCEMANNDVKDLCPPEWKKINV
jgi:hypothetical protein